MNDYLRKELSEYFIKVKSDIALVSSFTKFQNRSLFANRMTQKLSHWDSILKKEIIEASETNRLAREINENSNELYIIKVLLLNEPQLVSLIYEKPLLNTAKTIDLYLEFENKNRFYLDIKTIQPENFDAWDKYLEMNQHLHGNIDLEKEGLGGIFWHKMVSSRSKMLEYTIELEEKVPQGENHEATFMVFCSNGSDWHRSELEDFADFYNSETHRWDDFFRNIEQHHITSKGIILKRNVNGFCYFERKQFETENMTFAFNINGPTFSWYQSK